MQQRGRKSAQQLAVPKISILAERPEPPAELSPHERQTWLNVVSTKAADWFRADTWPLLISFCRHVELARKIDLQLEKFSGDMLSADNLAEFDKLLKCRERQSAALVSLARAMRISQHSQYHPRTAARAITSSTSKPWEPA